MKSFHLGIRVLHTGMPRKRVMPSHAVFGHHAPDESKEKAPKTDGFKAFGGAGGIRTHGRLPVN